MAPGKADTASSGQPGARSQSPTKRPAHAASTLTSKLDHAKTSKSSVPSVNGVKASLTAQPYPITGFKKLQAKAAVPGGSRSAPTKSAMGASTGKAVKAKTKMGPPAETVAAECPVEAEMSEEEQRRMVQEALQRALEDTATARQQAWVLQVEAERRAEAKRQQRAREDAQRKREEASLRKALLEAAYDDDAREVEGLLAKADALGVRDAMDIADSHGNTLLSEAAAGGACSTLQLLLRLGADPNSRGEFGRTPLWRAAFLGKAEVVLPLLEAGADPRLVNEGGEAPAHVAAHAALRDMLIDWDVEQTNQLVLSWTTARNERREKAEGAARAAVQGAEQGLEAAKREHERCQAALRKAREELEKRIFEHDTCVGEHKPEELIKVTLDQIKAHEVALHEAQTQAAGAAAALSTARLTLREQQAAEQAVQGKEVQGEEGEDSLPGLPLDIKDLDEVLIRDVGGRLAASGRWPLVIDASGSGQASVFLRYLDTNYINALSSHAIEPNRLRRSILGALRYGKPVVLDLMEVALWPEMPAVFDRVQPGLMAAIMSKSLLHKEAYRSLIRLEDGDEYEHTKFQAARTTRFVFIILTSATRPDPDLVAATYPLRVLIKG
ncbi:hypothetical protein V8C86DRAFT_2489622 [Haematococcus lacustris]